MIIPEVVRIGSCFYDVEFVDKELVLNHQECYALIDYNNHVIQISNKLGDIQQQESSRQQEFEANEITRQTNETVRMSNEEARQEADIINVPTADKTNARIDIIYINSLGEISYLIGTAAAVPEAPSTPTGGLILAEIAVAANAIKVETANITDKAKQLFS